MRHLSLTSASIQSRLRRIMLGAALALGTFAAAGLGAGKAEAGVVMPAVTMPAAVAALDVVAPSVPLAENVRWVCGPWRCAWRPNWNYWYVPPYARAWGPPVNPGCYWRRTWGGGWVHVCP